MTPAARDTLLKVFCFHKDRIWLPSQVLMEYEKHRIDTIQSSKNVYSKCPDFDQNSVNVLMDKYVNKTLSKDQNYHPYFDEKDLADLKEKIDNYRHAHHAIRDLIKNQYVKRSKEYDKILENDLVYDTIQTLNHGSGFSYAEKTDIAHEGIYRFSQTIPPGYKDQENANKYGHRKYGDLFIWKEILKEASEQNRSVIFITNDKKEDWYENEQLFNNKKTPRLELLQEFHETVNQDFWLYTFDSYIEKLVSLDFNNGKEEPVNAADLDFVRRSIIHENASTIRIKCHCGREYRIPLDDIDFDWDECGWSDREMGTEVEYDSTQYFDCPSCHASHEVEFQVFEYPNRVVEFAEIKGKNCTVLNSEDIDIKSYIIFEEKNACVRCGTWAHLDNNGLCDWCKKEIQDEITRED